MGPSLILSAIHIVYIDTMLNLTSGSNGHTRKHIACEQTLTLFRRLRQVNFASGQVSFQFTCPNGQVEILEKTMVIKINNGACLIRAS